MGVLLAVCVVKSADNAILTCFDDTFKNVLPLIAHNFGNLQHLAIGLIVIRSNSAPPSEIISKHLVKVSTLTIEITQSSVYIFS